MGHSLADVDLPYFREIIRRIDGHNVRWQLSYYHDDDLPKLHRQLEKLGVPGNVVEFAQLANM
jgi:hypothetical protein